MILIGTSGFSYDHWTNGVFYPPKLARTKWLGFYADRFPAVELNVTFYRLPGAETFIGWHAHTPAKFQFALKGSRYITHIKRLKDVREPLRSFFDRAKGLKNKFTVALWQLPPAMHRDLDRLNGFIRQLKKFRKVRHVFEFRHAGWWCDEVFDMLREHGMGFCHADYLTDVPKEIPDEMPFHYVRFHGIGAQMYAGDYPNDMLADWAARIGRWKRRAKDVYVFFNNDAAGFAVKNARELMELLT